MTDKTITAIVAVLIGIISVAVIALLVSNSAQTGGVLNALSSAISNALCTAMSPVTGKTCGGGLTPSVNSRVIFN